MEHRITDDDYENPWIYMGSTFSLPNEELEKLVGFVYIIEGLTGEIKGKKYIGQKLLWSKKLSYKTNPTTKVRKKIKTRIPSDWKKYYGSSTELQLDVQKYGASSFSRTILHLCDRKGNMNYLELKEQIIREALIRNDHYNSFVGGKIHRKHVKLEISRDN